MGALQPEFHDSNLGGSMTRSRRFALAFIASVTTLASGVAFAQTGYPTKPIKVVVPFPAGSTTDILSLIHI
jgi:tripartite-type tricarboxylate transporter receptor subunit TctC